MDPDALGDGDPSQMSFGSSERSGKVWKDIWGCGQGIGAVKQVVPVAELVARLKAEHAAARAALCQG
jgi:nitronate monooxygenase